MGISDVKIAQLVEHSPEEGRVGGSSPPLDTKIKKPLERVVFLKLVIS